MLLSSFCDILIDMLTRTPSNDVDPLAPARALSSAVEFERRLRLWCMLRRPPTRIELKTEDKEEVRIATRASPARSSPTTTKTRDD